MNRIWWGIGEAEGVFVPIFNHKGLDYQLFSVRSKGKVELYFHYYQIRPPFDSEHKRIELLKKINSILDVPIPTESITKLPKISISTLCQKNNLKEFLDIYEWFISEVQSIN